MGISRLSTLEPWIMVLITVKNLKILFSIRNSLGSINNNGAIVAREYGIPAVVNVPGVMKIIKDSKLITVDGNTGKVYL